MAVQTSRTTAADLLAATWLDWAPRLESLPLDQWRWPTRCEGWTVHALVAHASPDPDRLAAVATMILPGGAAVADAADALRLFNQAGGAAHTLAPAIAHTALAATQLLAPGELARRFRAGAEVAASWDLAPDAVVPYPAVGSITVGGLVDVAILEATVHLLDLIAAVGGPPPPSAALAHTAALLARVADPVALIEAAAGRAEPATALPVIR